MQELHLKAFLIFKFYNLIFGRCKNLQKLTLNTGNNLSFYSVVHPHWDLNNLTYFETSSIDQSIFRLIQEKLPNLKSLKCGFFKNFNGTFEKLKCLTVKVYESIRNINFPNLRKLFLENDYLSYERFTKDFPNLESFEIKMKL